MAPHILRLPHHPVVFPRINVANVSLQPVLHQRHRNKWVMSRPIQSSPQLDPQQPPQCHTRRRGLSTTSPSLRGGLDDAFQEELLGFCVGYPRRSWSLVESQRTSASIPCSRPKMVPLCIGLEGPNIWRGLSVFGGDVLLVDWPSLAFSNFHIPQLVEPVELLMLR